MFFQIGEIDPKRFIFQHLSEGKTKVYGGWKISQNCVKKVTYGITHTYLIQKIIQIFQTVLKFLFSCFQRKTWIASERLEIHPVFPDMPYMKLAEEASRRENPEMIQPLIPLKPPEQPQILNLPEEPPIELSEEPIAALPDITSEEIPKVTIAQPPLERTYKQWISSSMEHAFEDGGILYGKEHVHRLNTMAFLMESFQKKIDYLTKEKLNPANEEYAEAQASEDLILQANIQNTVKDINEEIEACKKFLNSAIKSLPVGWLGSQSYRDSIKKYGLDGAAAQYTPAIVNFRIEELKDGKGNEIVHFLRAGAFTDPRDGSTNLIKLEEEYQTLSKHYHQESLSISPEEGRGLKTQCRELALKIKERRIVLQAQMLQLITMQSMLNIEKLERWENGKPFVMVHMGLLNQEKNKIDDTGYAHIEENAIQDTAKLFAEFENKLLIFDGLGPYIDYEGNVHLPIKREDSDGGFKKITLKPVFFNFSVQKLTENIGLQEQINKDGSKKLMESISQDQLEKLTEEIGGILRSLFDQNQSSFDLAEDFSFSLLKLGFPFSIFCWSAKDRTGYIATRVIYRFLNIVLNLLSIKSEKIHSLMDKFNSQMFGEQGIARRIARECTGDNYLKITPDGRAFDTMKGKIILAKNYFNFAISKLPFFKK